MCGCKVDCRLTHYVLPAINLAPHPHHNPSLATFSSPNYSSSLPPPPLQPQVFPHDFKTCSSLASCAALKISLAANSVAPAPVIMAFLSPTDIKTGWDSTLLDGAYVWGGAKDHLLGSGHALVTAQMLCCSPLLGPDGKDIFVAIVAHDLFLQKHGRKVYDAVLSHVARVLTLFDEAYIATPEQFAIGTSDLFDIGKAALQDMSLPTDPTAAKGAYNYKDEGKIGANLQSYRKVNRQQQLACSILADSQIQPPCTPASGGFALTTSDTAKFLVNNKLLSAYKNGSTTQSDYVDSTFVRQAPLLLPGVTVASLRARGPGPETALPSPAATRCIPRQVLTAAAGTFGDGHAPGGVYLDGVECGWVIPGPSAAGKVLRLSLSFFSCEVERDYLTIYAGGDATGSVLGHYSGRLSGRIAANTGLWAIPSVASSTTGMFVTWTADNTMSRPWVNPSEDGFAASYNAEASGCSNDAQCGGGAVAGVCNKLTGLCVCSPGYGGSDCSHDSCFGTVHLQSGGVLKSHAPGRTTSRNNARCVWELDTASPDLVASLRFEQFDLENKFDKLRVYSYSTLNVKTLLREFSGNTYALGLVVRSPGQRLAVEFSSDAIHASKGFRIAFESKALDKDCEKDADCSGSGACRQAGNLCVCNFGFTGRQCECGPGFCKKIGGTYAPKVHSVVPSVISPKGAKVSIIGSEFRAGIITVLISDKICSSPVFKSDTLIECTAPSGWGGPHSVDVSCGGSPSVPRNLLSYFLPHIYTISKRWIAGGSVLRVGGLYFSAKTTKCRMQGLPDSRATYIDDRHVECKFNFEFATSVGRLEKLKISNDEGQRWVSGVTVDSPIEWAGGSLIPVAPRTFNYPKEVVIGGTIPTDKSTDPTRARQYITDITFAYEMAAAAVNKNGIFPGGIQLRVEVLPVDPGGSGKQTTVTEVTTAFAKKDASTPVSSVHDPSKCIEFGFPISGEWQDDPECCSIHAKAGCSDGYNKVKGSVCGSGSWGLAHDTTCEAPTGGPLINVVGMVGFYWSANAITAARAVSNPYRLPMVSYDAWSAALDSAAEFPYFLRVGPANSDRTKIWSLFMQNMDWLRVAVLTDDDNGPEDFGWNLVRDVKEIGGTVLYHGIFPTLDSQAVVNKQGRLHMDGFKNISNHLSSAKKEGARVIFVMARGNAGRIALYSVGPASSKCARFVFGMRVVYVHAIVVYYGCCTYSSSRLTTGDITHVQLSINSSVVSYPRTQALDATGFFDEGYAVLDGLPMDLSHGLIASGMQQVNGIVHITAGGLQECQAVQCPHMGCGPNCVTSARELNQAHDAVYTLASAIAPFFQTGGGSYLAGDAETRQKAMAAMRATSLSKDIASSGRVDFPDPAKNNRNKWNFG